MVVTRNLQARLLSFVAATAHADPRHSVTLSQMHPRWQNYRIELK